MGTRKNKKFNKFNKRFRKTRSKRGGGQLFSQPSPPPICPICRENLNDNCITLECGHQFDKDCLKDWCKTRRVQPSCPMCREPIRRACRELLFTDLEKLLFDAIKVGEIDFVEEALALGLNPDGSKQYDNNNIPRLNIDVKDKNGNTPLIIAVTNNEYEIVDLLLRQGADMESLNDDNKDAYHIALDNENTYVVNMLLEHGYYDSENDSEDDAIQFLSNQQSQREGRGGKRKTRTKRQRGGVKKSKKRKRDDDDMALIKASRDGHTETVAMLLEKGADVNAKDNGGYTALLWASHDGHTEIVAMLLDNGANVNVKDNDGFTALYWASQNGHTEIVAMLLENKYGTDVNAKSINGQTALHSASNNGHTEIVTMLLEKGANVNAKMKDGDTALFLATNHGRTEMVRMLLEDYGADVNAKTHDDWTALHLASGKGYIEIVAMLLEQPGIDVNAKNEWGYTALIMASDNGYTEIVAMLLENGADVNAKKNDGETALIRASEEGHAEIVRLIRNHIKHKNLRDARLVTAKGTKEDGTPLLPQAHRDVATMVARFMGGKRKTRKAKKSKKRGRRTRSKRGGDIESKEDDNFIVTIAIITHGCIIDTDPKQNQYDLRYYSATGDKINTCDGNVFGRSIYHDDLIEYFRQDNPSRNDNNNTINELPDYFDDIPYDKVIGKSENQGFINDCIDTIAPIFTGTTAVGVWLISVHKEKLIEKNNQLVKKYEYIYPTNKNKHINLFNIEGFKEFNQIIGKNKFNITSELVENNKPIPKKENNIRNFQHWDVELNNTKERINYIRLSYLFDLIKKIAGNNCKLNVYDYTCSINCNDCNNINNNNQEIKQGLITGIEEGKAPFFTGGKRKTRKAKKNRRRRKKAGADTPDSSFDEGHTDRESISIDPDEPFHVDIEVIPMANEVHELEMELLDDSFASENPDESFGTFGSIELDDDNDDDTPDLDASLSLGGKRKTRKSKKSKRKSKRKTRRK